MNDGLPLLPEKNIQGAEPLLPPRAAARAAAAERLALAIAPARSLILLSLPDPDAAHVLLSKAVRLACGGGDAPMIPDDAVTRLLKNARMLLGSRVPAAGAELFARTADEDEWATALAALAADARARDPLDDRAAALAVLVAVRPPREISMPTPHGRPRTLLMLLLAAGAVSWWLITERATVGVLADGHVTAARTWRQHDLDAGETLRQGDVLSAGAAPAYASLARGAVMLRLAPGAHVTLGNLHAQDGQRLTLDAGSIALDVRALTTVTIGPQKLSVTHARGTMTLDHQTVTIALTAGNATFGDTSISAGESITRTLTAP